MVPWKGSAGSSFNFYNPQTDKWQQFWVWRNGTTLELEGAFADGTVRQHWEISKDSGKAWATAFDGHYRRAK